MECDSFKSITGQTAANALKKIKQEGKAYSGLDEREINQMNIDLNSKYLPVSVTMLSTTLLLSNAT